MSKNKSYFAALVTKPTIIVKPGKYQTRCGEIVKVEIASARHEFGCVGVYANGVREVWHKTGRLYATRECANDIVSAA